MTHPFKPVIPQGASEQSVDCQSRDKTDSRTENDKHLRSFYDNSPIAYHSLDSEGRFIEINPAWLQMLGYTREEVIGRWAGDFLIPEQVEVFKERFPLFKKLGAIHKVPFNFLRKDGGVVAVEVDGRIAYDEQGDFLQTHCVLHDVTERKRAKQMSEALRIKENQYRELFESGSDALLLIAIATGKIIDSNKMAAVLFGYKRDELLTKLITELSAEPDETSRIIHDPLNQTGRVINIPVRLCRKKDGTVVPVEITARSFLQDGAPVLLVACRDITERKRVEAELQAEKINSEAMFESSPIALFVLDDKANIVRVNGSAVVMFGGRALAALQHRPGNALGCVHSSEDPRGCGYSKSCPLCPVRNGIEALLANGGEMHEVDLVLDLIRDGVPQKVWMEIGAKFVQIDGRRHVCVAMVDITLRKRTEEALRLKNLVFDASISANSIADSRGVITEANDSFLGLWGFASKDEVTGRPVASFFQNQDEASAIFDTLNQIGKWEGDFIAKRIDGSVFTAHGLATVIRNDRGEVVGYQSSARDITARKQAEAALEKQNTLLTTLMDNLQIGVYMVEVPSGKPLLANQASFNLLGRGILPESNASTLSKVYDVYKSDTHQPYPNEEMPIVVAMQGVAKHVDDMLVVKPDGTQIALEVFGSPIKDLQGNIWASLVSFQDITARKQAAEAALQLTNTKNKFISVVSHELRSPLATIKEATSLVREEVLGPLNDEQRDMLEVAKININRLGRLIQNVLTYQKIDAGKMLYDFLDNDVNELMQEVYRNMILANSERKNDIVMNLAAKPPRIRCDRDKVMQVLINLISNAIKYSERGSIVIETRLDTREIVFSVRDSGQGIFPEELENIFMPFSHGRERKTGGTGLGLAISKEIVVAHKGKIWAESEKGKGSTFYFTLPR